MICNYCNNNILENNNIYKGFDMDFCSVYCRINVSKQIYKFDHKTMNYNKWNSIYAPKNNQTSPLKKTKSIRKDLSFNPNMYNTEIENKELEKISNEINNNEINNNEINNNEINKKLFENEINNMDYYFYDYTIGLTKCKSLELFKNILESRPVKYIFSFMFNNY